MGLSHGVTALEMEIQTIYIFLEAKLTQYVFSNCVGVVRILGQQIIIENAY